MLCVTSDHATPCALKVHSDTPVAVLISGGTLKGDKIVKFSEKECEKGSLGVIDCGWKLMPELMQLLKA
jgi:2,3-bisphosphoglycerate-independent phosphoglycerate mutase